VILVMLHVKHVFNISKKTRILLLQIFHVLPGNQLTVKNQILPNVQSNVNLTFIRKITNVPHVKQIVRHVLVELIVQFVLLDIKIKQMNVIN